MICLKIALIALAIECICFENGAAGLRLNQKAGIELNAPRPDTTRLFWGAETNKVKAGLSVGYYSETAFRYFKGDADSIPIRCFPLLHNENTNTGVLDSNLLVFDMPLSDNGIRLDLIDDNGNPVNKTEKCKMLGKTAPTFYKPSPDPRTGVTVDTGWRPTRCMLLSNQSKGIGSPLFLDDYFQITNSGKYHLRFGLCAFKSVGAGTNELVHFPVVDAEIEVQLSR